MTRNPLIVEQIRPLAHRSLHDGWTLRAASGPAPAGIAGVPVPAQVPGVVHTDLLAAGLIPDPYLDENEALLAWIGLVDWTYETTFVVTGAELAAAERHDLVFDGLDTVATVLVNGAALGQVANQHRTHRFDVTDRLRAGANTLTIAFRSPVRYANEQSVVLGARPRPYPLPYDAVRKAACSFGWDWGIATFTSGIWRPVRLESWSGARLADVRVHAEPDGAGGWVEAVVRVERTTDAELELALEVAGSSTSVVVRSGETSARVRVELDRAERWWPAGYGAQPLYDVSVRLRAAGDVVAETSRRVGFRSLWWNTDEDAEGTPFQLIVNDEPVLVKGVNWIPDDAFFPRVDRARYERRLRQAREANLNLVRVWGGGIYESDDFYELCDELGLLAWQDFAFACAAYAEEEPLRSEVEAEARDNVSRIAHHASLALLCGNNESLWGFEDWGWKERLDGRTWGGHYYRELLPAVIADIAPHVPYAPGSPFSPNGEHPNDERHGTTHLWEQWNRQGWPTYRDHTPRFIAEFGWQGPPAWSTLTRSLSDSPLTPDSPGMIAHQKAAEGNVKLANGLVRHYRVPDDMETWHWAMQLNQANAVGLALDHFRSQHPRTTGAIVWQLNDCWPVTSWAAIDGDGVEKPLLFAMKNSFAPRVVSLQPRDGGLVVTVGNDTGDAWNGALFVRRITFAGEFLATETHRVSVPARATQSVALSADVARARDAASELVVAELDGARGLWFFAEPRESALEPAELEFVVTADGDATAVTVTSRGLVRDLTLLVDKLDPSATVDHGLVTLLPGESFTFRVRGPNAVDAAAVGAPEIARSGNQLVAR